MPRLPLLHTLLSRRLRHTRRRASDASPISEGGFQPAPLTTLGPFRLPRVGEVVTVTSGRSRTRLEARVLDARSETLILELNAPGTSLRHVRRVELEWVDSLGLVRRRGQLETWRLSLAPLLEVTFDAPPELIRRREHIRVPAALEVTAWSLLDPTRLIRGTTIEVGGAGALVKLAMLPPAASQLELRICLPDGPLAVSAEIVPHEEDETVAVAFGGETRPDDRRRLEAFVSGYLRDLTASALVEDRESTRTDVAPARRVGTPQRWKLGVG